VDEPRAAVRRVSLSEANHYSWGDGCDGWHLVHRPELSVIRERMPPRTAEIRHLHRAARQLFFVLSGAAVLEADGTEYELRSGEGLEVEPGVAHQVFNRSEADLELVVVSQPHSHGDREVVLE
jgi:mannose-6-phosphate isomerase-like protein (cupin superfamily)